MVQTETTPAQDGSDVAPSGHRWSYGWGGLVGAVLFGASSFTPSLLPRSAVLQGLLAGIAAAFGYGMGETVAWLAGRVVRWSPGAVARRRAWLALAVVGGAFSLVALVAGWRWQSDIHELMGRAPRRPTTCS